MTYASVNVAPLKKCAIMLALGSTIQGCAEITAEKIKPDDSRAGGAYCLAVPALQIIKKSNKYFDFSLSGHTDPQTKTITKAIMSIALIQDPDHYYLPHVQSGWFTSDSFSLNYDGQSCLKSLNATTKDQSISVVGTLASVALVVGAFAVSGDGIETPAPPADNYELERANAKLIQRANEKIEKLTKIRNLSDKQADTLVKLVEAVKKIKEVSASTYSWSDISYAPMIYSGSKKPDEFIKEVVSKKEECLNNHINCDAEKNYKYGSVFPSDKSNQNSDDFYIAVAQRVE